MFNSGACSEGMYSIRRDRATTFFFRKVEKELDKHQAGH